MSKAIIEHLQAKLLLFKMQVFFLLFYQKDENVKMLNTRRLGNGIIRLGG